MKYLKEVCEVCGAIEETPMSHISRGPIDKMEGLSIYSQNDNSKIQNIKAGTKNCLCKKCKKLAEKEILEFIENSEYFKIEDENLF